MSKVVFELSDGVDGEIQLRDNEFMDFWKMVFVRNNKMLGPRQDKVIGNSMSRPIDSPIPAKRFIRQRNIHSSIESAKDYHANCVAEVNKSIDDLEKADEMGIKLNYSKAAVSGGALFPSLRDFYSDQGIECLQCYGTAELGCIAYESNEKTGMIIEEGVIIEIVTPGTGNPVKSGEVGEVLVTTLGSDYPLIRFATGDMSAIMSGQSSCGRTNTRIKGWMGRADQTTKIKGMFVRPEQVAELVKRHKEIVKARVVVKRDRDQDRMVVKLESLDKINLGYTDSIQNIFRINGDVEVYAEGELPIDGLVIEDLRKYE